MIAPIAALLVFQLIGETLARALTLPVPGPVIGMGLLLVLLAASPRATTAITPTANGLLGHLSLLFVPAGVGVVGHLDLLATHGVALIAALVLSTVLALTVGALTFVGLARLTGQGDAP